MLLCRQIRALQPQHASRPAAVGGQERLRHGRSHHCARKHSGSTRGCVARRPGSHTFTCSTFPPVAVNSRHVSSGRRGPSGEQHGHRLCLLLSIPALRADGTEHPEGWERSRRGSLNAWLAFCWMRTVFWCKASLVRAGLQQDGRLKVRVEPGLFEWTKWVSGNSLPAWIPPVELAAASFSIDTTYRWQTVELTANGLCLLCVLSFISNIQRTVYINHKYTTLPFKLGYQEALQTNRLLSIKLASNQNYGATDQRVLHRNYYSVWHFAVVMDPSFTWLLDLENKKKESNTKGRFKGCLL